MLAFDWSGAVEKTADRHVWIEVPFTHDSPIHERVALIAVVAATEAAVPDRGWEGIQVGRRQVRAWAESTGGLDREAFERYITEAAGQAEGQAQETARSARMAQAAAQQKFAEAKAQAERLAQGIRGS